VRLYNANSSGRITPKPGLEYVGADMIAKKASLPAPAPVIADPIVYNDFSAPGYANIAMKGAIYLFETAAQNQGNPLNETCIVVGGIYGTDTQESYYRLDFFGADGSTHLDVLRNYKYTFNINSVSGRGYSTVLKALNANSYNMKANLLKWDENDIHYIAFNNQYMLGVSEMDFFLTGYAHSAFSIDNILKVNTDYPPGWTATVWENEAGTIPSSWLSLSATLGAGGAQSDEIHLIAGANNSAERTAYIHFTAGTLICKVKVVQ
jgi:ABC-type cobalt transport system substrate-binding protein